MRRRTFFRALGTAATAAWWKAPPLAGLKANPPGVDPMDSRGGGWGHRDEGSFQRWTWVHGNAQRTPAEWNRQFEALAGLGYTGVLVGGGDTEALSGAAHEQGLEFHRWIWTLNRNGDAWVKENRPDWFTLSRNLDSSLDRPPYVDYYRWLCPTKAEVRSYLQASILEIAQDPQVDGIHLDYIRHSDVILPRGLWSRYDLIQDREYPEFDYCYCDTCREAFSSRTGRDPLDIQDPTQDEAWRRFRWDSVTGLVKVLADAVHTVEGGDSTLRPALPGKPVSAAVFPTPTIARRLVRQAWDEWPLDAFFPMLYHEFYEEGLEWIGKGVEEGLRSLTRPDKAKLFAGLYLPTLNRDGTMDEAVDVARKAGATGVSFFEMNGLDL